MGKFYKKKMSQNTKTNYTLIKKLGEGSYGKIFLGSKKEDEFSALKAFSR